jgi:cysteinyl-tRNA synthetase
MRASFHALPDDGAQADGALLERFGANVNDDLNAPRALAIAWEALRGDLAPPVKRATLARFDDVFGLGLTSWQPAEEAIPDAIAALASARAAARKARNWAEADRLRDALHDAGWTMEDRPDGYALKRRSP